MTGEIRSRPLLPGEPAPWFRAKAVGGRDQYVFDTTAGRYILLLFMASAVRPDAESALAEVMVERALFDDAGACFFGVTAEPADVEAGRVAQELPGIRYFLDEDRRIMRLFGAESGGDGEEERLHWLILDPSLRAVAAFPISEGRRALAHLKALLSRPTLPDFAPVLMMPRIFEPDLCKRLIAVYEAEGGEPSGFMRERDGKTVLVQDSQHKQRRDASVDDPKLRELIQARIRRRLLPMVKRAFQFEATRMERYIVACYEAGAGHFRPHRDNTTRGTAHRRFAVTINLNAGDYEGGDLRFPEYGPRTYRPPTGGAVVFSCSLLHEAMPVVRGRRYAFLPFLYDEAAARQREENTAFVDGALAAYRAGR